MAHGGSLHERFARARKVSAMIEFLDHTLEAEQLNPFIFARELPSILRKLPKDFWLRLAVCCGQRKPSEDTIKEILASYENRANESQQEAS